MIPPSKPVSELDEDDDLDLPEPVGALGEDEDAGLDDEADLDLDDEEDVGLDADTGLDETLDDELSQEEEAGTWLDEGAARDADELDEDLEEDDEDGWTEGSEPVADAGAEDWDEELSPDDAKPVAADSGEEGFGDESVLGGLDFDKLPPLDDSADGSEPDSANEAFSAELLDALTRDLGADEALEELVTGVRCVRIPQARVKLEELHRGGHPLHALLCAGDAAVAWDGGLLVRDEASGPVERRSALGGSPLALAAVKTPVGLLLAVSTPEGLTCSVDGGRTFVPAGGSAGGDQPLAALAFTQGSAATRLWAARAGGPLLASDDLGATFRCVRDDLRVLRLATDGESELLVTARAETGGAHALRTADGGLGFAALEVPVDVIERLQDLQICGTAALCCRRAPEPQLLLAVAPDRFAELAPAAAAPACLIRENGEASVYFFVLEGSRAWLLRRALDGDDTPLQIVAELPANAGAPLQLAGRNTGGVTALEIGTERAWYCLRLDLSGKL